MRTTSPIAGYHGLPSRGEDRLRQYNVAIVGLTKIATGVSAAAPDPVLGHVVPASHTAAYASIPSAHVVAVCDLVPDLLTQFKETWGERYPEVRTYTDYRRMLSEEQIDLLDVVTPDHRHAEVVVAGAEAGVKGILCEKPMATTLHDADEMISACERSHTALLINHNRRWYPAYAEARRLIRSGAIGPLRSIIATLGGRRAMVVHEGTHLVDAVCYFAESWPAWLVGRTSDDEASYGPRYAGDGGKDPSLDPGANAYLHFENGVRAFITISKATPVRWELDLMGESGRMRVDASGVEMWRFVESGEVTVTRFPGPQTTRSDLLAAVSELITLVEGGGAGSSTGRDGRRDLSILLGILQSSHEGGSPVTFPVVDR